MGSPHAIWPFTRARIVELDLLAEFVQMAEWPVDKMESAKADPDFVRVKVWLAATAAENGVGETPYFVRNTLMMMNE